MNNDRTIEQFHADRESGSGCPEVDGGPHYFAFIDHTVDYRVCIDCGAPEKETVSNGSEHIPEATDYKTLTEVARRAQGAVYLATEAVVADDLSRIIKGLADAVESLLAENEKLRTAENLLAMNALAMSQSTAMSLDQASAFIEGIYRQATDQRKHLAIRAERDTLQAQLDATGWEYGLVSPDARPGQYGQADTAHLVSSNREHIERQHRRGHPSIQFVRRRKAGEWTAVEGVARPVGSGVQRDGTASDRPAGAAIEDPDSPSSPAGLPVVEGEQD